MIWGPGPRIWAGAFLFGRRQRIAMRVTVKYSGFFHTLAGVERETVDLTEGGTINHMVETLSRKHKKLPLQDEHTFYIVNNTISKRDQILTEGDHVIILRMFAGG